MVINHSDIISWSSVYCYTLLDCDGGCAAVTRLCLHKLRLNMTVNIIGQDTKQHIKRGPHPGPRLVLLYSTRPLQHYQTACLCSFDKPGGVQLGIESHYLLVAYDLPYQGILTMRQLSRGQLGATKHRPFTPVAPRFTNPASAKKFYNGSMVVPAAATPAEAETVTPKVGLLHGCIVELHLKH